MARGKWSDSENEIIQAHIDKYASQIRDMGLLPGKTLAQIDHKLRNLLSLKRLSFQDATTADVSNIRDMIMRHGVTIDECAEKYETTPRRICQLMGWER